MNHAITVGDVVAMIMLAGGVIGFLALVFWLVFVVFNPFKSGH